MAKTYADLRNCDTNEAYTVLEQAFHNQDLISSVQRAVWRGLSDELPAQTEEERVEMIQSAVEKSGTFVAPKKFKDDPASAALVVAIEKAVGRSSGEAMDLLDTEMGKKLLDKALRTLGAHFASQLIKKSKKKKPS